MRWSCVRCGGLGRLASRLLVAAAAGASPEPAAATGCAACHGEGGRSVAPAFPNLAGQQAEYLQKQLVDFRQGPAHQRGDDARRLHKCRAATFRPRRALHRASPRRPARSATPRSRQPAAGSSRKATGPPEYLRAGAATATAAPAARRYPRLAGQNSAYTLQQLADFKAGARHNDTRRMMREIAGRLTEAQMKALAEYLAGL